MKRKFKQQNGEGENWECEKKEKMHKEKGDPMREKEKGKEGPAGQPLWWHCLCPGPGLLFPDCQVSVSHTIRSETFPSKA